MDKEIDTENNIGLNGFLEENEPKSKWATKASVFTNLFSDVRYTYQLYRALHPEDDKTTIDEITLMTIESHMLNQQYNDLGFMVGERLIILAEAQSTWSENIVLRVLLYVVQTWYKYIKKKRFDIYAEDRISLPIPELYVIYTGSKKDYKPEKLSLKDNHFTGKDIGVNCEVKILYDGAEGDIINQYVRFCHIFNEQIKLQGRTRKAVEETIRICQSEAVLEEYLEREREEIMDIMLSLFDEETLMKNHDATIERKSRNEGRKEGEKEISDLFNYLLKNNRGDDAIRASEDEPFREQLLEEFRSSKLTKEPKL